MYKLSTMTYDTMSALYSATLILRQIGLANSTIQTFILMMFYSDANTVKKATTIRKEIDTFL